VNVLGRKSLFRKEQTFWVPVLSLVRKQCLRCGAIVSVLVPVAGADASGGHIFIQKKQEGAPQYIGLRPIRSVQS
jgi:hypothetical protein